MLRFAPSPTGPLHLGGLRTALVNYLTAKQLGARFILRIEDTDRGRYIPDSLKDIQRGLAWAEIFYDYGPDVGGPHAPYVQSERLDLYKQYANKLLQARRAYRCFCTANDLTQIKTSLKNRNSLATYDKRCLQLTDEDIARRIQLGHKYVVRFDDKTVPLRPPTQDLIFGPIASSHSSTQTDPILLKSDGFPTYHLASVVDDHEMDITLVIRGEEWLPSLPLHLDLFTSLELKPPNFAHLPVFLNTDGTKMSKRNGDVQVADYIKRGWEPSAMRDFLLSAGWKQLTQSFPSQQAAPSPDALDTTLQTRFDLSHISRRRAILNPALLEFLNKKSLHKRDPRSLAAQLLPICQSRFPSCHLSIDYLLQVVEIMSGRYSTLNDIPLLAPYLFIEPDLAHEEAKDFIKSIPPELSIPAMKTCIQDPSLDTIPFKPVFQDSLVRFQGSKKQFWSVLRFALSGQTIGPSIIEIASVLGRERVVTRLKRALEEMASQCRDVQYALNTKDT